MSTNHHDINFSYHTSKYIKLELERKLYITIQIFNNNLFFVTDKRIAKMGQYRHEYGRDVGQPKQRAS